jgi:hypothetical protein
VAARREEEELGWARAQGLQQWLEHEMGEYGLRAFCRVVPALVLVGTGLEDKDVAVAQPLLRL